MSSNLNKKNNEQKNYNFVYSPININNKISFKKDTSENLKSTEQPTKSYYSNISYQNKNQTKNMNINHQSEKEKEKEKVASSPTNKLFYKSKIQNDVTNTNNSKNYNEIISSQQNSRSPISLTGRITNLHNIKLNKEKSEEEKKNYKGSNINLSNNNNNENNNNKLVRSSNIIGHNSKSVNNNNNNKGSLKFGNNIILKTGNLNEGLNNLRKENIYGNAKKNNYNFNNNNHGIINNMNNNTSKNKKKNENSNNSNLNVGMLSFSTSNISVNNLIPVNNNNNKSNINDLSNNDSTNNLNVNNINIIKNSNISEQQNNKNNLNLCLDCISNTNNKNAKLVINKNKNNIQTKSAEKTTRNPKYFKNESIYNTNYIINFIDSNDMKNGKLVKNNKINDNNNNNQIYIIEQKEIKKNNFNNKDYKKLTDITKNNVNEILSKKNVPIQNSFDVNKKEEKKNSENNSYSGNSFIKKYFNINDGNKYKNPEELHFSMVNITQNINKLKVKF